MESTFTGRSIGNGSLFEWGTRPDNLLSADKIDDTGLYVLTNYKLYNGAAMIAHDEMAQK